MTAEELFRMRCGEHHNIDQHLPIIRTYASACSHVTELGVERGWSTSALLASRATRIRSYDWVRRSEVDLIESIARDEEIDFRFILGDSRRVDIEPTDLLFVDTDHTYEQVEAELCQHIDKVARYLIFHDVATFPAIVPAIERYCSEQWKCVYWTDNQHGLAIYERISY